MERPDCVDARLEVDSLLLEGAAHRHVVRVRAAVHLHAVLDTLHPHDPHPVPRRLRRQHVCRRLFGCRLENGCNPKELLAAEEHIKKLAIVHALVVVGAPMSAQSLRGVAKPALGLEALLAQALAPRPDDVRFRTLPAEQSIDQAGQEVILQQRLHVVAVAQAGELARGQLAAVGRVVQEAPVLLTPRDERLQVRAWAGVHLVV
mmetsp:Transcript_60816/g.181200  ORF Transcript_60816/g.181200 Transcript_60816/m.181200 type:complete len:204 (+) Transcript_60816:561-1172(+)